MKRKVLSIFVFLTLVFTALAIVPSNVSAATEEEIEDSIALGLPWLASQQNPDGSWGNSNLISKTGLAVLKFIDHVKEVPDIDSWTDPGYIYHDVVVDGLDYLFSNGYYVDITIQTYGDPDTLDNDKGIRFNGFDDYETSIALIALGATMTQSRVVTAAGPLNGLTYADVVQDIVDYLSFVQRESTYARGGWGYQGNPGWADNSVSGYASLGLGYAQAFGATIPQFVKDELVVWINQIQAPDGHSYYRPPAVWGTPYGDLLLRTGNLLYEMALVGWPVDDPQVQLALNFIENYWALGGDSYQRAFCLMKGLEAYGIEDEISVGVSGDWFDELSTYIVSTQNPDGSWPNDPHDWDYPYPMTASWALLTLEKAVAIPQLMTIDKTLSASEGELGDMITVTINVNNPNGYSVTVVDTLPKGFHFIEGTFTVDGISATPTIDKHEISYTFTETGPHVIEFDVKIDEAKSWEDMEVCNIATATWYEGEDVIDTKEDIECFIILPFEQLHKNVGIPKADVVFAIDLTGSMGGEIATVKSEATNIMNNLATQIADVQFGLMSFMDYDGTYSTTEPGSDPETYTNLYGDTAGYGDYPYQLDQDITSDKITMAAKINALSIGWGGDGPQDYTRIVHESYNDANLHWRTDAVRFLIIFGDNVPHDTNFDNDNDGTLENTGGDPGRDATMGTDDDLNFETEVANAAAAGVHIMSVYSGWAGEKYPWTYMADETDGGYHELTDAEDIPDAINDLIKAEAQKTLTVKVGENVQWAIIIDVVNPFGYTMGDTMIKDNFGAEIEIDEVVSISQGDLEIKLKGKSEKVSLKWEIGDLLPGETARLILLVSTDLNPAGHQEYTSPGIYELNSGATLKFIDTEQDTQLSAYTDSIYVTALP